LSAKSICKFENLSFSKSSEEKPWSSLSIRCYSIS
jgi:hypothetical protein